ncbi:SRPBCC domain-containing protein [Flavobacterium sp. 3HN19-14]|uniref:SRPBCC domain-containing protein n=1 Tax=Flavobacterium sp. 3HN19-14 TaxID=3448133 RepID=UPI003EE0DB98
MQLKTISKTLSIFAPREKVWEVLTNDEYNKQWYAVFSEGTRATTDWELGSKAIFTDEGGNGIVGKIIVHDAFESLAIEYEGMVRDGKEDYETQLAKDMKGCLEVYKLTVEDGVTQLDVACDMGEEYYFEMSEQWDKAMHKIKQLAEGLS